MINFKFSTEKQQKILDLITTFMYTNEVTCAESVYQVDSINEASIDLVAEIVEILEPRYSDEELPQGDVMVKLQGVTYRCYCGCNVFRWIFTDVLKCNSCGSTFEALKEDK